METHLKKAQEVKFCGYLNVSLKIKYMTACRYKKIKNNTAVYFTWSVFFFYTSLSICTFIFEVV